MTAIAGRWNFGGRPAVADCAKMLAAQRLYGPHDTRQWDDSAVALGRALYQTLPEDAFDRQPLSGGGGRWQLVADVRLDNREELAEALHIDAAEAHNLPDAAFLLRAWERWQDASFGHLLGDYAIAVWDAHERRLILARDATGGRPLHYHVGADFAAFASMPKGLHALAEIPYAADEERVAELLVLMPEHGPRSFFRHVSRVEAGQLVAIGAHGVRKRRHWCPEPNDKAGGSAASYAEGLRAELGRAVAVRLRRCDGEVGTHLSGGLDSAAVTATAARTIDANGRIIAFTSVPRQGYDGADPAHRFGDEGPLAAATAALYPNIDHILVRPDGRGMLDDFDRDFFLFERPVINPCNQQWMTAINAAAQARGVRVLLTGAMGNMSISYSGAEFLPQLAGEGRWLRLAREAGALVRAGQCRWRGALASSFGPWMPAWLWLALHRASGKGRFGIHDYSAIHPAHYRQLGLLARARAQALDLSYRPRKSAFETRLWALQRVDSGNYGKGVLAGWGIDLRDPTADRRLIEYCLGLPMEAYVAKGQFRRLARTALADRLPPAVLDERRKGLQAVDWHERMMQSRNAVRDEVARFAQVPAAQTALDLTRMQRLIEKWPEADWHRAEISNAYRLKLLRGTAIGHFLRKASRTNA